MEGWEATPVFHQSGDMRGQGVRVSPDRPEPNVILEFGYAAHAAGLGEVGRGKWLLTPEFGPRQMLTQCPGRWQEDVVRPRLLCRRTINANQRDEHQRDPSRRNSQKTPSHAFASYPDKHVTCYDEKSY